MQIVDADLNYEQRYNFELTEWTFSINDSINSQHHETSTKIENNSIEEKHKEAEEALLRLKEEKKTNDKAK